MHKDLKVRLEYYKQYYLKNKEKIKTRVRQYQNENKTKIKDLSKNKVYSKTYYEKNKEKRKKYYLENKEKYKIYNMNYYQTKIKTKTDNKCFIKKVNFDNVSVLI